MERIQEISNSQFSTNLIKSNEDAIFFENSNQELQSDLTPVVKTSNWKHAKKKLLVIRVF